LGLNNLILLYDDNKITIDGKTDLTFTEDVHARFAALNWNILDVADGDNDIDDIYEKILFAKSCKDKPTIIFIKTTIGYGSLVAGKSVSHGAPLGKEKTKVLKEYLGMDKEKIFYVENEVKEYFIKLKEQKIKEYKENQDPDKTNIYKKDNLINVLREISKIVNTNIGYATRESSSIVLKKIVEEMQNIVVGSADLAESNKTLVSHEYISKDNFVPKYLHYGIREHSMCAIANGISTYDILPIVSTFLVFITYCLAPIRMAALSKHKVLYIFTHDSVFLGEDGPTHQPVESLTILRSIPNLLTIRPCDTTEVSGAYQIALGYEGPCALILSRQAIANTENSSTEKMKKGAYVVYESLDKDKDMQLIIISTGSEVSLAIDVAKHLNIKCRVVSMPCASLFDKQDIFYKEEILPKEVKKMSLEAGSTLGWYKYADYVYGIDTFGESGNIKDIKEYFEFILEKIVDFIQKVIF